MPFQWKPTWLDEMCRLKTSVSIVSKCLRTWFMLFGYVLESRVCESLTWLGISVIQKAFLSFWIWFSILLMREKIWLNLQWSSRLWFRRNRLRLKINLSPSVAALLYGSLAASNAIYTPEQLTPWLSPCPTDFMLS